MRRQDRGLFIVLGLFGFFTIVLGLFLFMNRGKLDLNTRIVEVGHEYSDYYCNIEYFDLEKVTPDKVEQNRQKCTEAVSKLFGTEKAENVKIRYKQNWLQERMYG